jgi:hypothetical protein
MNAVLSVQGNAFSEETKPSFLSRVFNKKTALKVTKAALPLLLWRRSSRMLRWPPPPQPT